ncbi:hypothetical protein [Halomarina rubra]|uniref:Uncharacterized protein n=1 Tax=Halomarina rubra TaxID=2071873 RepID=A0ABD6B221_9EURY|nr:hypothetical protein [Halomarina rubra]
MLRAYQMRLTLTRTDSEGSCPTRRLGGVFEGERFDVRVFSTGTTEPIPEPLGQHLLDNDRYAVAPYEGDGESEPATAATEDH